MSPETNREPMTPYLIFTDLDGTLLHHDDYSFTDSERALKAIKTHQIPLIINSSKTKAEISNIRTALNNNDPFIVENGAALYIPKGLFERFEQTLTPVSFSPAYPQIIRCLHALRQQRKFSFTGFHDLSISEVQRITGLSTAETRLAKQRIGTEPLLWQDTEVRLIAFQQALEQQGLKLVKGGRFYHVMGQQADKANAMNWLAQEYRKQYGIAFKIIALGDSENDRTMLEQSDIAAVIRQHQGTSLKLERNDQVIYTTHQAPRGWQEAIDEIFKRIKIGERDE